MSHMLNAGVILMTHSLQTPKGGPKEFCEYALSLVQVNLTSQQGEWDLLPHPHVDIRLYDYTVLS
jgi:hypothetical protein